MKQGNLKIAIEYKPFNTYKNVKVINGSNRQNYNANTRHFEPDRRIDPYVVLVECGVNDPHNIVTGLVNANLTDVTWKVSSDEGYKDILSTDKEFKIGTGADKGKLTIFKNVSDIEPLTILFTARYYNAQTKRVANFQESFNLVTLPVAQAPILIETSAPVGYNLFPTENNQGLICQADLFQGKNKVPAAYWWYKGDTLLDNTNGYQGAMANSLFVPADKLSKTGDVFRCEVADCSEYLNGLVADKVDNDPQVVEWRGLYQSESENLLIDKTSAKGYTLAWASGMLNSSPGSVSSDYIKVIYNIQYISNKRLDQVMCYDIDKRYLGTYLVDGIRPPGAGSVITTGRMMFTKDFHSDVVYFRVCYRSEYYNGFVGDKIKLSFVGDSWSPAKIDLQDLITQKTTQYKSETTLPENYRPTPKPEKLWQGSFMLMKQFPLYDVEILYPTTVSPEATSVQVEMVLNTNDGVIPSPERFFSVGWLKQTDGSFKYKGFKVNIAIADIVALTEANKQLDYELREDLILSV